MSDESTHDQHLPPASVCPYCGAAAPDGARCPACRGLIDPLSRQATQNDMGPWFLRDEAAPFLPGCSFHRIVGMVRRGRITASTVMRGPTTRQFWMPASRVPGVANLLGHCHNCRAGVEAGAAACTVCGASFAVPADRQNLGLAPIHAIPGQTPAPQGDRPPPMQRAPAFTAKPSAPRLGADAQPSRAGFAAALVAASGLFVVLWLLIADARFDMGIGFARAVLGDRSEGQGSSTPSRAAGPATEGPAGLRENRGEAPERPLEAASEPPAVVREAPLPVHADPQDQAESALRSMQKRLRGLP